MNDTNTNPICPNIPNAVPETILEKPLLTPTRTIIPTFTIPLMVYIKGPSHWNPIKGQKRKPIFKIRKILLGFLYAAQRVCPEARLCNVYKDLSMVDIIQIDDIPKTEVAEKSYIFDAQVNRGTFQGQILLKANKEFSEFIRNSDFHDWLQMENIQIQLQPHTGVKFVKIGFFTDVINSHAMDSFHVKTLHQWLTTTLPPFELFTDIIYTTHNRKKFSSKVLYVFCKHDDRNEVNSQIESLSNVIPWTYYESKYFHAFGSELKSTKIKDQSELHKSVISYLLPGFIDNDTILMNYTKHTIANTTEASSTNTVVSATDRTLDEDQSHSEDASNTDEMEADEQEENDDDNFKEDEDLQDINSKTKDNIPEINYELSNDKNTDNNDDNTDILIPDDYVGSFMEKYYKNEHEQPFYFQVGPVVENQREVLVFKKNRLYAEKMNQIIIGDLSLHMTPEACSICLDKNTIQQQLQIYRTWKPCHIQNYMATKNIYKINATFNQNHFIEQPKKRHRNDVPTMITTNVSSDSDIEQKKINAAAAEVFSDEIIDLVKQTTDKHLSKIKQTNDIQTIDKVEFEAVVTEWKTKFESLEKTIITHNESMDTILSTLALTEIKTNNRFGTVYDTIETKCNEIERTVLKVKEETNEMYERAQEANDTKHDELLKDNRILNDKIDKLLGHFKDKPEKKMMKSQQAIETFREKLTHHTSESMTTDHE